MYIVIYSGETLREEKISNVLVSFLSAYSKLKQFVNPQARKDMQAFVSKVQE